MKSERRGLPTYAGTPAEKVTYRETQHSWFGERELTQNIQHHLWDRESGLNRYNRRGCIPQQTANTEFYKSITPRLTIMGVANNLASVRRFTPDGKHLLSFIPRGIRVLEYSSVAAVQELLGHVEVESVRAMAQSGLAITYKLFPRYWDLQVIPDDVQLLLNRDFCMFVGNRYVILLGKGKMLHGSFNRDTYMYFPDVHDNRDMYELVFYLIDLEERCVTDEYEINDSSNLSTNYGISVYGNEIAILSLSRQVIQVFDIVNGQLSVLFELNIEEEMVRELLLTDPINANGIQEPPPILNVLSPMKQQVFSYLYREAMAAHKRSRRKRILEFYKNVPNLDLMRMYRIQLINEVTILIRFQCPSKAPDGTDTYEDGDSIEAYKLFVFYSMTEQKILKIFPYDSVELLNLQHNFYDYFRPDRSWYSGMPTSSPSNNPYFSLVMTRAILQVRSRARAAMIINSALPFNTQGVSCSPYFNYNMFGYDDRWISSLQIPKLITAKPIAFEERRTGLYKFRLHIDTSRYNAKKSRNKEKLVTFVVHPYEPFIISAQHIGNRLTLNYHLYCETTIVNRGRRQKNHEIWPRTYKHENKKRI